MAKYNKRQVKGGSGVIRNFDYKPMPKPEIRQTKPVNFTNKRHLHNEITKDDNFVKITNSIAKGRRVINWHKNQGKMFKTFRLFDQNDIALIISDLSHLGVNHLVVSDIKIILENYLLVYFNFVKNGYEGTLSQWFIESEDEIYESCTGYNDKEDNQGIGYRRSYCISPHTINQSKTGITITLYTGN